MGLSVGVGVAGPPEAVDGAPPWLELIPVTGAAVVAGVGSVGLVLAMAGHFSGALALMGGLPVAALVVVPFARSRRLGAGTRTTHAAAVAAAVLALAFVAFAGRAPSEHLLVNRDPGSYISTALWMEGHGSLTVDARWAGFDPAGTDIEYAGSAQYDQGGGHLEAQFNHLTSTVLATADWVGGSRVLFRVPAVVVGLGLLAVYAVAVRATGRPVLALAGVSGLGASMPFLYVARDTFSEPFSLLLLWAAIVALLEVHRRPRVLPGVASGILLGAAVATRIDSILYLALLAPAVATSIALAPSSARRATARAWAACTTAALALSAVGMVDLFRFAGGYAALHGRLLRPLVLGTVAVVVASGAGLAAWSRWPGLAALARAHRDRASWIAGSLAAAALLAGWLVRPHLGVVRKDPSNPLVQAIQSREGLARDATRTYAELAVGWTAWYLGAAAMVAAVVGLAVAIQRSVAARAHPALLVVAGLLVSAGTLSWWQPSVVPDQIWAMRRFVPAVLPSVAVLAVFGLTSVVDGVVDRAERFGPGPRRWVGPAMAAVGAVLLVVPPAVTTGPVRGLRELRGLDAVVAWTCDQVGPDQAVVVVGALRRSLPQTLRNRCDVPVGIAGPGLGAADLAAILPVAAGQGRSVVLVALDPAELAPFRSLVTTTATSAVIVNDRIPLRQLTRAPGSYGPGIPLSLTIAQLAPPPDHGPTGA